MTKKAKFSVVVAVYNRPEEMSELLESIFSQEYRDFEIIIVDDGSQKSSREIFQVYRDKLNISYFFTENHGPALARNFGVSKSEAEWVIFFDSDCTIPQNYFLLSSEWSCPIPVEKLQFRLFFGYKIDQKEGI